MPYPAMMVVSWKHKASDGWDYTMMDDETLDDIKQLAASDRLDDFQDIALLTAHTIEAVWGWSVERGSLMGEDGSVLSPHAWNRLPDGTILDAQNPDGTVFLSEQDDKISRYRPSWFPWLDENVRAPTP